MPTLAEIEANFVPPTAEDLEAMPEVDFSTAKIIRRGPRNPPRRITIGILRAAIDVTQEQVAERTGWGQGEVSRIESRADRKVSTLARYAEALGGTLEVAIVLNGRRYVIEG